MFTFITYWSLHRSLIYIQTNPLFIAFALLIHQMVRDHSYALVNNIIRNYSNTPKVSQFSKIVGTFVDEKPSFVIFPSLFSMLMTRDQSSADQFQKRPKNNWFLFNFWNIWVSKKGLWNSCSDSIRDWNSGFGWVKRVCSRWNRSQPNFFDVGPSKTCRFLFQLCTLFLTHEIVWLFIDKPNSLFPANCKFEQLEKFSFAKVAQPPVIPSISFLVYRLTIEINVLKTNYEGINLTTLNCD